MSAIFNSDGNFPFKITLLIKSVKVMHISFTSELKTFATSGFILIYAEDSSVSFPREIVTEFVFSFSLIILGWLENVSKIVFRF